MVRTPLTLIAGHELIDQVIGLARRAGAVIGEGLEPRTDWKPDGSPVTAYDRKAHEVIVDGLKAQQLEALRPNAQQVEALTPSQGATNNE